MTGEKPSRKDRQGGTLIWTSAPIPNVRFSDGADATPTRSTPPAPSDVAQVDRSSDDTLTVIAALVEAPMPLTIGQIAHALGWERERVAEAIERADELAAHQSPVTVKPGPSNRFVVVAAPDRLTDAQRKLIAKIK